MSKATLRREEARGLFMDEDGPFGETDTFLNEIYPVGVEAKVLESCNRIPIEPIKCLRDAQLKA